MDRNQQLAQLLAVLHQLRTGVTASNLAGQSANDRTIAFSEQLIAAMKILNEMQETSRSSGMFKLVRADMQLLGALNNIGVDYSLGAIDAAIGVATSQL
jgi:hypothetical protein